jgi:tetratricopeptide (TPR) repeat protein
MAAVWERYPTDADVGALYAESLMDLRPWDLWSVDRQPRPDTPKLIAVLEQVLRLNPEHPGANHFYIHTLESSPNPEKAAAVADRLKTLVPAAGHLVHMPTHIYVLTGRWAEASEWNESAIKADREYREISPRQGFYRVYMMHNAHMLSFASEMEGRSEAALDAARAAVGGVPADFIENKAALVDPYMGAVYDVLKRFGRWDDILKEPAPSSKLPITTAMWRMNRAVAYAAKGEVNLAEQERTAFQKAAAQVPPGALMAINTAADILQIAEHFLNGEIAYRRGDIDEAVRELRAAMAREDQLRYMEPPEWVQPVRHTLGAVLVSAKRFAEAEKVYREDLAKWPENGWSLHGLARCLREQDKSTEAKEVEARFQKAWSRADTPIESSCKCVAAK